MQRTVIALDVDGTLFDGHRVSDVDAAAVRRAKAAGHVLMVVTGRRWVDMAVVLGDLVAEFDRVVVEEGGAIIDVAADTITLLAPALDQALVDLLTAAEVTPLDAGLVMVGTHVSHLAAMADANERTGGRHRIVVNKTSVALVPQGFDKGTGLRAAVEDLGAAGLPIVAIGDAENDLPMFAVASTAIGMANADATVRNLGIPLTSAPVGGGVAETLERLALTG